MIIGVSGKARSGKGEFAKIAMQEYGAQIVNFAGALKEEVMFFLQKYELPFRIENLYGENAAREELCHVDAETIDPDDFEYFKDFLVLFGTRLSEHNWKFTYRSLMQWWGTEFRRKEDPDYWVKRGMEKCIDENAFYVIDDLRFENEAEGIIDAGGSCVRVERPSNPNPISNPYHPSECSLDDWIVWTHIIENTTTIEEYHTACRCVLDDLLGYGDE